MGRQDALRNDQLGLLADTGGTGNVSFPTNKGNTMKSIKYAAFGLALCGASSFAADCTMPDTPALPDGGSASMEEMLSGQKAIKAFQAANMDYMGCLEEGLAAAESALKNAPDGMKDAAKASYQSALDTYNAAVSMEEEVVGEFNIAIREFKAAQ